MLNFSPVPTASQWGIKNKTPFFPINNMGVTARNLNPKREALDLPVMQMLMTSDGPKPVECRRPAKNQCAMIDWVNFTFGIEALDTKFLYAEHEHKDDADQIAIIECMPWILHNIFGLPLGEKLKSGRNFYKHAWNIGDGCGLVCVGGQRDTILVMLTGTGCALAKDGWEKCLYSFLSDPATKRAKLTRVDLAHDDFEGAYCSVDWADQQDKLDGFWVGRGKKPSVEHHGNWRRPSGAGRTISIGKRDNGKYLRVYEKGKAEGDSSSLWCRVEVEFKATDRFLPFDMLIEPSDFFVGAYPCFAVFDQHKTPAKIATAKKAAKINWDKALQITRHQFGKYIKTFGKVYDHADLVEMLSYKGCDSRSIPPRLKLIDSLARIDLNRALPDVSGFAKNLGVSHAI